MSIWREIRYYAKGTPTKTTKRLRRRHLFTCDGYLKNDPIGPYRSPCGLFVFKSQMSKGPTDAARCGNCVKVIAAKRKKK